MPSVSFDRAVDYYDETRGFAPGVAEQIRDAILAHTKLSRSARFLEMGVGTGRIALPFIEAGYAYAGLDISTAMMARLAPKLADDDPNRRLNFALIQANIAGHVPFADASFDVAIMVHVLHLIDEWQAVLNEARRILRPSRSWLLIARSDGQRHAPIIDQDNPQRTDAANVRAKWNEILRDLGLERHAFRPGNRAVDTALDDYLHQLGAKTETALLAEYDQPPVSPRTMAERLKARMYSGDWNLSDDVHAEAVRRLDKWLNEECPNPDTAVASKGSFSAMVASWGN